MTMAKSYMRELGALLERQSKAAWKANTEIDQTTRNHYLEMEMKEVGDLIKKYNINIVVLKKRGILKNERYEFPDGSSFETDFIAD